MRNGNFEGVNLVLSCVLLCFFFFFSSRRRHTRLQGDWSSDVCSSDLFVNEMVEAALGGVTDVHRRAFANVLQVGEVLEVLGGIAIATAGRGVVCFEIGRASCRERV